MNNVIINNVPEKKTNCQRLPFVISFFDNMSRFRLDLMGIKSLSPFAVVSYIFVIEKLKDQSKYLVLCSVIYGILIAFLINNSIV